MLQNKAETNFDKQVFTYLRGNGRFEEIANYSTSSSEEEDDEVINLMSDEDDERSLIMTLKKNKKDKENANKSSTLQLKGVNSKSKA